MKTRYCSLLMIIGACLFACTKNDDIKSPGFTFPSTYQLEGHDMQRSYYRVDEQRMPVQISKGDFIAGIPFLEPEIDSILLEIDQIFENNLPVFERFEFKNETDYVPIVISPAYAGLFDTIDVQYEVYGSEIVLKGLFDGEEFELYKFFLDNSGAYLYSYYGAQYFYNFVDLPGGNQSFLNIDFTESTSLNHFVEDTLNSSSSLKPGDYFFVQHYAYRYKRE